MIKRIFFFFAINATLAVAQPFEEPVVSPLEKGQTAPFSGVLLNKAAVSKIIVDKTNQKESTQIEIEKAVSDAISIKNKECADIKVSFEKMNSELDVRIVTLEKTLSLKQQETDSLKKQLEAVPDRNVLIGIGFAGGIALTLLTVFATSQIAK